jgi:DNA-binding PadR family transcriptional regulator
MEEKGYLRSAEKVVEGKRRRWYTATPKGRRALQQAKAQTGELFREIVHDDTPAIRKRKPRSNS